MFFRFLTLTVSIMAAAACHYTPSTPPQPLSPPYSVLGPLPTLTDGRSHRASSGNPDYSNDDNITAFAPGQTVTLLNTDGPGRINHIWLTVSSYHGHYTSLRDIIIRMYWDDAPVPSVEVPLGDFFGLGLNRVYPLQSLPIAVGAHPKALNCYWPMPFYENARIELYNNGERSIRRIYYNIDYVLEAQPPAQAYFHALFRRQELPGQTPPIDPAENYVILETEGQGHYVGTAMFVESVPGGWWGEGDEMIYLDHSPEPVMLGTGTEDYFGNAWGYKDPFSYPFYGAPLLEDHEDGGKLSALYRWHVPDPIRFREHIKVTMEHNYDTEAVNEYSSVAYWYQSEPITQREPLPTGRANWARWVPEPDLTPLGRLHGTAFEPYWRAQGLQFQVYTHTGFGGGYVAFEPGPDGLIEIPIPVDEDLPHELTMMVETKQPPQDLTIELVGGDTVTLTPDSEHIQWRGYPIDLGMAAPRDGALRLRIRSAQPVWLVGMQLNPEGVEIPDPFARRRAPETAADPTEQTPNQ